MFCDISINFMMYSDEENHLCSWNILMKFTILLMYGLIKLLLIHKTKTYNFLFLVLGPEPTAIKNN